MSCPRESWPAGSAENEPASNCQVIRAQLSAANHFAHFRNKLGHRGEWGVGGFVFEREITLISGVPQDFQDARPVRRLPLAIDVDFGLEMHVGRVGRAHLDLM